MIVEIIVYFALLIQFVSDVSQAIINKETNA